MNNFLDKNAMSIVESSHSRLINLFKRSLDEATDWPQHLQSVVFALNSSLFSYGSILASPSRIFNSREFNFVPWHEDDVERNTVRRSESVRKLMETIAKERKIDNPSLSADIEERRTWQVGDTVLIWREHIVAKRKLKNGKVNLKVTKSWSRANIIERIGRLYVVRSVDEGNIIRKVHVRAIRPLPPAIEPNPAGSK